MTKDMRALEIHKKYKGKITLALRDIPDSKEKLSLYYSPGVGSVAAHTAEYPEELKEYSWTNNLVAVISDGSAVLGLGNIGPYGAMPVMEGKAMLFKHFAHIDAVPIVLDVHDTESIVNTIAAIAPSFGGINLEDIAAPQCFEIEARLKDMLDIPVMHDDQHGTAIVVLAGLINACKLTKRSLNDSRIIVNGVGAAGVATIRLLRQYAPQATIVALDSQGIIGNARKDLNHTKRALIDQHIINPNEAGDLTKALGGADIFIGVSKAGLLQASHIRSMTSNPIIFALANPNPEILPEEAIKAGAAIVATGRSDYANQVNNALAFPGIFRGALDNGVAKITDEHKLAAAEALAGLVEQPTPEMIIPSPLDDRVVSTVAQIIT